MAVRLGQNGEMAIILKVKDDGSVVVEKFGKNSEAAFDKTGKGAEKAGKKWKKFAEDGKKYAAISSAAIAVIAGAAIKVGAGFEQAIANVASVAGANDAELKRLATGAREQAKVSVFSATQAAEAQYSLASAGYDVNQILAAQANVMSLAAATGADLASTSEITTATLSQFNLKAEDSSRIANVFAASISGSQATLQKLGDAMRYVGPVANALDIDLESTTAAISLLFNTGFKGEQAGTILRSSLIGLQKPSKESADLIASMGLQINDANGKFVGFSSLIEQLADKQISLNEAAIIFGAEAAPGMLALVNQGAPAYEKMRKGITDTNKAMELADKQTNTLTGDYKLWISSLEESALVFYDKVNPAMRSLVQSNTDLIEAMGYVVPGSDAVVLAVMAMSSIVVGASKTFELLGTAIGGSAAALVQFISGDFTQAANTVSNMVDDMDRIAQRGADLVNQVFSSPAALPVDAGVDAGAVPKQAGGIDDGLLQGRGDREAAQTELLREELLKQVEVLAESQLTESELLFEKYANEQLLLDDALEIKAISEEEFMARSLASTEAFETGKSTIKEKEEKKRLALEKDVNKAHAAYETARNNAEKVGREQVYVQGINLLRRFADDNKAITLLLIAIQTAKTVKEIQVNAAAQSSMVTINANAAAAMIVAYSQIEAAGIMAATLGTGTAAAGAALSRGAIAATVVMGTAAETVLEITANAALATGLAIAGGIVDAINQTAGAPGSSTNPINVTSASQPVIAADTTISTSTSSIGVDSNIDVAPPPSLSPAEQQAVLAVPREINLAIRGDDIFSANGFADGLTDVLSQILGDGKFTLNTTFVS